MVPRLREFFRQGQAKVVSNSKNKILATWEPFFLPGPVYHLVGGGGGKKIKTTPHQRRMSDSITHANTGWRNWKHTSQTGFPYKVMFSLSSSILNIKILQRCTPLYRLGLHRRGRVPPPTTARSLPYVFVAPRDHFPRTGCLDKRPNFV